MISILDKNIKIIIKPHKNKSSTHLQVFYAEA